MIITELIDQLNEHPMILDILLECMTDEEFAAYAHVLADLQDRQLCEKDQESFVAEAIEEERSTDTVFIEQSRAAPDVEVLLVLGRVVEQGDLFQAWRDVDGVAEYCQASPEFRVAWRKHVAVNLHGNRRELPRREQEDEDDRDWTRAARRDVEQLIGRVLEIVEVDTLGPEVFSVILAGPHRPTFVFSRSALAGVDPIGRDFMLYHMVTHVLIPGHVPVAFAVRVEYKRGHTPRELYTCVGGKCRYLNGEYIREEGDADDGATCMLSNAYVTQKEMTSLSRRMVRGAMQRGVPAMMIRDLFRERLTLGGRLIRVATRAWLAIQAGDVSRFYAPPLRYCGPLRVVRPRNERHVYVIGEAASEEGGTTERWRRWVCSGKVLTRLGLAISDVEPIADEELAKYQDKRPLLDPYEVDELRDVLCESILDRKAMYLTSELELATR